MERVSSKTQKMVLSAILSAIVIVLGVTQLGFIPVGPIRATILHIPVIIAAIFGGPIVGVTVGAAFGIMSFLQAPTDPTFAPIWAIGGFREIALIAVTAIVPRVLIGLVSAYVYKFSEKISKKISLVVFIVAELSALGFSVYQMIININQGEAYWSNIVLIVAILVLLIFVVKDYGKNNMRVVLTSIAGTLTNTVLFILLAYNFFKFDFAKAFSIDIATVKDLWITAGVTNGLPEVIVSVVLVNYIAIALLAFRKNRT